MGMPLLLPCRQVTIAERPVAVNTAFAEGLPGGALGMQKPQVSFSREGQSFFDEVVRSVQRYRELMEVHAEGDLRREMNAEMGRVRARIGSVLKLARGFTVDCIIGKDELKCIKKEARKLPRREPTVAA